MQYELLLNDRTFTMFLNNFARDCKHDVTNKLSGKSKKMGCSKSRDKPGSKGDHSTGKGSLKQGEQSHRIKQGQARTGTASTGSRQGKVQGGRRQGQRQDRSAGYDTNSTFLLETGSEMRLERSYPQHSSKVHPGKTVSKPRQRERQLGTGIPVTQHRQGTWTNGQTVQGIWVREGPG